MVALGGGNDGTTWHAKARPGGDRLLRACRQAWTEFARAMTTRLARRWSGLLVVAAVAVLVATIFTLTRTLTAAPTATQLPARPGHHSPGRAPARPAGRTGALARHPVTGADAVGTLFTWKPGQTGRFTWQQGQLGRHFCTASVVTSPAGDLVLTAAHCVTGTNLADIVFAPGYANGKFPHGLWAVSRKFVNASWAAHHDPNDDFAFLVVRPLANAGQATSATAATSTVEQATGAERLRFDAPLPTAIRAVGYPDASSRPHTCTTRAVAFRPDSLDQVKFVCPGFTDGTSGGPFLSDYSRSAGTGAIIGVIGGYQQGGDSPGISYSAAFAANVRALYSRALHAASAHR
jgi:Trypsin-like peptidase domain